jgi:hypothetical protein
MKFEFLVHVMQQTIRHTLSAQFKCSEIWESMTSELFNCDLTNQNRKTSSFRKNINYIRKNGNTVPTIQSTKKYAVILNPLKIMLS